MKFIIIAIAVILVACTKDPVSKSNTNNATIQVETLFTHENCTVYRFVDDRPQYFVKCKTTNVAAGTINTHTEYCGKGCTKTFSNETPTIEEN